MGKDYSIPWSQPTGEPNYWKDTLSLAPGIQHTFLIEISNINYAYGTVCFVSFGFALGTKTCRELYKN